MPASASSSSRSEINAIYCGQDLTPSQSIIFSDSFTQGRPFKLFLLGVDMQNKSLWQAYRALHPRTRVWIGVGGMIVATLGMGLSDYLEKTYPATEREREQAELLSPVTVVDRHPDNKNA